MAQSFARWLIRQASREDAIGALAKDAKRDPGFPKEGDVEAVRRRLREIQAEGETFAVVDDAEMEWPGG